MKVSNLLFALNVFLGANHMAVMGQDDVCTLLNCDFESGPEGFKPGVNELTQCGNEVTAPAHWTLGNSLPGTTGVTFSSQGWTNPNDGNQGGDESSHVTSPNILSSCTDPTITFDSYTTNEGGTTYDVEHVQISINGGPFTDIHGQIDDLHMHCDMTYRTVSITTSGVNVGDSIRYRFLYDTCDGCCGCSSGSKIGWFFDNVIITCPSNGAPCPEPGIHGDPHVQTWNGEYFDYMGECDLVMIHAPNENDPTKDLDLHVRATVRYDYSFVESAALRIGDDVLEVSSFGDHALNGVTSLFDVDGSAGYAIAGYPIHYKQENKKKRTYDVVVGPQTNISFVSYKDIVSVYVNGNGAHNSLFEGSTGLMGSSDGTLLGRDGVTDMSDDTDAFGQEWQVRNEEPMLFRSARAPQYPTKCVLPDPTQKATRRLGEGVPEEAAENACARFSGVAFENCVKDVVAFNDLEYAQDGAY